MTTTGTTDEVTTDTTDTTDGVGGSPVTRRDPDILTRAYDICAGIACMGCGIYLLARGIGAIDYPEVTTWQSP